MSESEQGRRPVARAFLLQEVLVESVVPLGISELARRANLPKSTVARIMVSLTEAGIARRVGASYVAGTRLLSMADRIAGAGAEHLSRWLLPYLVQLHDITRLAVAFATLHHGQVHFTNIIYGRTGAEKLAGVPEWVPAELTSAGKLLLAHSLNGTARLNGMIGRLAAQRDALRVDPAAFSRELWRVRREGIAYHNGEYVAGHTGMAAALYDRNHGVAGAITLGGPAGGFDVADARTALRQVAGAASTDLRRYGNGGPNGSP
jgi:DNA-binding IclR family transcriptional regulator